MAEEAPATIGFHIDMTFDPKTKDSDYGMKMDKGFPLDVIVMNLSMALFRTQQMIVAQENQRFIDEMKKRQATAVLPATMNTPIPRGRNGIGP